MRVQGRVERVCHRRVLRVMVCHCSLYGVGLRILGRRYGHFGNRVSFSKPRVEEMCKGSGMDVSSRWGVLETRTFVCT